MNKRAHVSPLSILDAIRDKDLFAPWFKDPRDVGRLARLPRHTVRPTHERRAARGLSCNAPDASRRRAAPFTEAWLVCGRRAGKSFMLALCSGFSSHLLRLVALPGAG